MRAALAAVLFWVGMAMAGLSLVLKLESGVFPTFMPNQEYWLAMGGFLALLVLVFSSRAPR